MCLFILLFFCYFSKLISKKLKLPLILIAPFIWTSLELLQTYLMTGFPWLFLGYSQYLNLPLLQITTVTGIYGLSFIIVLFNCILVSLYQKKNYLISFLGIGVILVLFIIGSIIIPCTTSKKSLCVGVLQPNAEKDNITIEQIQENFKTYFLLSEKLAKQKAKFIVWPETAILSFLAYDPETNTSLCKMAQKYNLELIVGSVHQENKNYYNSAFLISEKGLLDRYDKTHLVPFGEYILGRKYIPWISSKLDLSDFTSGSSYNVLKGNIASTGTLICFESIFPNIARNFVKKDALFLCNITNDAWFGKTAAPYQHALMSIFRAAENRVPLVRSANTGVSLIIDAGGRIITQTQIFKKTILKANIFFFPQKTFYTKFGDIFAFCCLFISILLIIISYKKITLHKIKEKSNA
ncbi:MAG: apolipoprotein N-acyltransferase [bacterium]